MQYPCNVLSKIKYHIVFDLRAAALSINVSNKKKYFPLIIQHPLSKWMEWAWAYKLGAQERYIFFKKKDRSMHSKAREKTPWLFHTILTRLTVDWNFYLIFLYAVQCWFFCIHSSRFFFSLTFGCFLCCFFFLKWSRMKHSWIQGRIKQMLCLTVSH